MDSYKLEKLKSAFKGRECIIRQHSNVIEITFKKNDDADWFENIFEKFQKEDAACCLMPIKPKGGPSKFIFNIKDIDRFSELIK